MVKKEVLIKWDETIFVSEKELPNSKKLYTQLYDFPNNGDAWTLVVELEETPKQQGVLCFGKVYFLVCDAPSNVLIKGFVFNFYDGRNIIGTCEIL